MSLKEYYKRANEKAAQLEREHEERMLQVYQWINAAATPEERQQRKRDCYYALYSCGPQLFRDKLNSIKEWREKNNIPEPKPEGAKFLNDRSKEPYVRPEKRNKINRLVTIHRTSNGVTHRLK